MLGTVGEEGKEQALEAGQDDLPVISLFTTSYAVVGVDIANSQVADPLVYSLQSFTSLGLDPPQGANTVVDTLTAFEGFVGGFFIALFVVSLTRSLHR